MDHQTQLKNIINESVKNSMNDSFYLISDDINLLINDNIMKYSPLFYMLFSLIIFTTILSLSILIITIISLRSSLKSKSYQKD